MIKKNFITGGDSDDCFFEFVFCFAPETRTLFFDFVFFAGIKIHIEADKYRIPDIVFLSAQNRHLLGNKYWKGADIAMEVVSEDDPNRDLVTKRAEYAQAGIPEYWIVDPQQSAITVLKLDGTTYAEHGCFKPGERAASVLLPGFEVDVASAFEAGRKALG